MKKEAFYLEKGKKYLAMLAPSFIAEFEYPKIVAQLRKLGFDKIVELTFGAKMVNREYHQLLSKTKNLLISSVCPGIVELVNKEFPEFKKNIIKVDSPMVATAKISKKVYPNHKVVFLSPCNFKKTEALNKKNKKYIDFVLDFQELKQLIKENGLENMGCSNKSYDNCAGFDKFYNEYTRIYPLSGGLSKTAHLKGVLKKGEEKTIDGFIEVRNFLRNPYKKVKFLDVTFCRGGCIGGQFLSLSSNLKQRHRRVLDYLKKGNSQKIPLAKKGNIEKLKNLKLKFTN